MCVGCCYLCKKCCGCDDPPRPATHQTIVVHQPVPGQFQQPQFYDPNQQGQWQNQQVYAPTQQGQWQPPMHDPNYQGQPGYYPPQQPGYPTQQWNSPPPGFNTMLPQPIQGYPPPQQQWNK